MDNQLPATSNWDVGTYNFQKQLGNFVQYFQVSLPTNSYGVPLKLISPLVIAENMLNCETTDDIPDHVVTEAIWNVDYEDGIPTVEGLPIWERFDGELLQYYKYFKQYRDMLALTGKRSIMRLSKELKVEAKVLSTLSKSYHWYLRCKAYDAYKAIERERMRQFEIDQLSNVHKKTADKLLTRGLEYIETHPEQLNPKLALQMIETAMKAGRLALGLNGDKPGSSNGSAPSININQAIGTGSMDTSNGTEPASSPKTETDTSYLQSIVHILESSGAFDQAKGEVIDAEFTELTTDDETAVEGT